MLHDLEILERRGHPPGDAYDDIPRIDYADRVLGAEKFRTIFTFERALFGLL